MCFGAGRIVVRRSEPGIDGMLNRLLADVTSRHQASGTDCRPSAGASIGHRVLVGLLCLCVAWTPWALVWADELADLGRAGQAFGQGEATGFALPTVC